MSFVVYCLLCVVYCVLLRVGDCSSFVVCYVLYVFGDLVLAERRVMFFLCGIGCSVFVVCCLLCVVCCGLFLVCCLLLVFC